MTSDETRQDAVLINFVVSGIVADKVRSGYCVLYLRPEGYIESVQITVTEDIATQLRIGQRLYLKTA